MINLCSAQAQTSGFIGSMTRFIDCQSQVLGSSAWHALALPGSTLSIVLSGFLTIFIALIGYNLLLGQSLTLRSGTIAMVKIGAVFALATSWPAYRTLIYDLVVDGPAQIVGDIGRPAGIPGSDGTLVQQLDGTDTALAQLAVMEVGIGVRDDVPPPPFAGFNAFSLGGSRILYLITAVAGLGVVRVIAGLMLALGPFFIAFLMFDSTRSLFEGWVRVLAGAALSVTGVSIALGFELAMLEPWLAGILARRMAGEDLPTVPAELFVVTCVFTLVVIGVLVACTRLARGFRLAPIIPTVEAGAAGFKAWRNDDRQPAMLTNSEERSRAAAVADVLVSLQRRESGRAALASSRGSSAAPSARRSAGREIWTYAPVGRSFARTARARTTLSGGRRDQLR